MSVDGDPATDLQLRNARVLRIFVYAFFLASVPLLVLLVARGPVDGKDDLAEGYWGAKTATVNWCEADYVVTKWIAEFSNAMSSLLIVASGTFGIVMHRDFAEPRYIIAFGLFFVIGIGSAAFHATLSRSMQLLDELPMVWANSVFIYIVITMEDERGRSRLLAALGLVVATTLMTLAIIKFDVDNQDTFLVCYGSGVIFLAIKTYSFNKRYNVCKSVLLYEMSLALYVGGFMLWLIDRNFCPYVRSLYLHSFWHLGGCFGTFNMVLYWLWLRLQYKQLKCRLQGTTPAMRWIELTDRML